MDEIKQQSPFRHRETVIYIEPNHLHAYDDSTHEYVETTENLEDYCLYCNLQIELVSRKMDAVKGLFHVRLDSPNGKAKVSYSDGEQKISVPDDYRDYGYMMQGSVYGDKNDGDLALTTNYLGIGVKELKNNIRDSEMFGVNSINISYDNWQCPTVEIQFTDVRGISLFGVEEETHNIVTADGMTGQNNKDYDITDSFFRAFFTFPYPRFTLHVKGFYGEPVAYELAISNFKATFDSKTGNFGANVKFIGFKFGILNDLTMTSLASVVSIKGDDFGRTYWDNNSARFVDDEGNPLTRLSTIVWKYQKYKNAIKDAQENANKQAEQLQTEVDTFKRIASLYKEFSTAVSSALKAYTNEYQKHIKSILDEVLNESHATKGTPRVIGAEVLNTTNTDMWGREIRERGLISTMRTLCEDANKTITFTNDNGNMSVNIPDGGFKKIEKSEDGKYILRTIMSFARLTQQNNGYKFKFVGYGNTWGLEPNKIPCYTDEKEEKWSIDINQVITTKTNDDIKKNLGKITRSCWTANGSLKYYRYANDMNLFGKVNERVKDENILKKYQDIYVDNDKPIYLNINTYLDKYKVNEKTQSFKDALTTIENSSTDENTRTAVKEVKDALDKITYETRLPSYNKKYAILPIALEDGHLDNSSFHNTATGVFYNELAAIPISVYNIDLSNIQSKIASITNMDIDAIVNEEYEKVIQEAADKYLNFNTSLRHILKSLWAHVEVFLHMCTKFKDNIRNSNRTIESCGLNKVNSNLPKKDYNNASNVWVPPFPEILKEEPVSGSNNTRRVHEWIGNVIQGTEEERFVNALIKGASQYFKLAHEEEESISNVDGSSAEEIQTSYYQYLRNLFEKWIHAMPSKDIKTKWGVDTYFDTHFLFIDTFYNRLTNEIGINREELAALAEGIFEHKGNTLMSFICDLLQSTNTILYPTQNFIVNDIENKKNLVKFYEKMFTPIPLNSMKSPDPVPYFVVIYRGDPSNHLSTSENDEDDGFMISYDSVDHQDEIPVGLRDKNIQKNEKNGIYNGYVIPAIGVTYGKQYQSFFHNINVDMNTSMANEVSLAAQYELCGASLTDNSGGGNEQNIQLGQDLFTVYANNSYTCTIDMLGCMWIQPLMYFQLNNIPMFRGTYMIQQVTHKMVPGNMTTTFKGVRMSKYSSPFVNTTVAAVNSSSDSSAVQVEQSKKASFDNDCPYCYYDPVSNESDEVSPDAKGTNTFTEKWLNTPFGTNFPSNYMTSLTDGFSLSKWYAKAKTVKTKYALASLVKQENSSDKLSMDLHLALIFNEMNHCMGRGVNVKKRAWTSMWSGHRYCAIKNSAGANLRRVLEYLKTVNDSDEIVKRTEAIFLKSPIIAAIGNPVTDGNGDNGKDERVHAKQKQVTVESLQEIYYTSKNGKFLYGHQGSAYYSYNQSTTKVEERTKFWEKKEGTPTDVQKKVEQSKTDKFHEKLLVSIENTFNLFEGLNNESFDTLIKQKTDENKSLIQFTFNKSNDTIGGPLLVDILFNCYYEHLDEIYVDLPSNFTSASTPSAVTIKYNSNKNPACYIVFRQNNTIFEIDESSFPTSLLKILKKKYKNLTDEKKMSTYVRNKFKSK